MDAICRLKFAKGHNSIKNVGGVMVLVLSILSDHALQSFVKVSYRVSELRP